MILWLFFTNLRMLKSDVMVRNHTENENKIKFLVRDLFIDKQKKWKARIIILQPTQSSSLRSGTEKKVSSLLKIARCPLNVY